MSDRVQGINRNSGLKVNRLRPSEPARPLTGRDREQKGRESDRPLQRQKQPKSQSESAATPPAASAAVPTPEETVTISLVRYETMKRQLEQLQRLDQQLKEMFTYSLVSVRGKDRPLYNVEVDRERFAAWLERWNNDRFEVADVVWRSKEKE